MLLVFFQQKHILHLSDPKSSIQPSISKDTQIRGSHVDPLCTRGSGQSDPMYTHFVQWGAANQIPCTPTLYKGERPIRSHVHPLCTRGSGQSDPMYTHFVQGGGANQTPHGFVYKQTPSSTSFVVNTT